MPAIEAGAAVGLARPPDHVVARIQRERASGMTLQAIADGLNADRVPTARNGASCNAGPSRSWRRMRRDRFPQPGSVLGVVLPRDDRYAANADVAHR